jgi:predicted transcriptional regulator of viral defense system/very-short-patch-repair endonuclease
MVVMRPQDGKASPDEVIGRLARHSHGVVTRAELLRAGVTPAQIRRRVQRGSLIAVHRGVYRVGHLAPNREAHYMAAVRACGDQAVLCGRAAAHLWKLVKGPPPQPEVRAPGKRQVSGLITHRSVTTHSDATRWRGIPLTNVPRTLVDLASSLPAPALARACHEAGVLYRTTPKEVDEILRRLSSAPGQARLTRVLHGEVPVTLSRLESRFLKVLRDASLPLPDTNRAVGSYRVDCRWPAQRLTVELDSYRFHNSHHSWERDRLREWEARRRGDEFRRYAAKDVFDEPGGMLADLRELLGIAELRSV